MWRVYLFIWQLDQGCAGCVIFLMLVVFLTCWVPAWLMHKVDNSYLHSLASLLVHLPTLFLGGVREIANLLHKKRTTPVISVCEKWVYNFVKRRPRLSSRFSKRYNYKRAKYKDPKIIKEWFNLIEKTILQFSIDPDDVYNFDKTGFVIGLIATTHVISRSDFYGRRALCYGTTRHQSMVPHRVHRWATGSQPIYPSTDHVQHPILSHPQVFKWEKAIHAQWAEAWSSLTRPAVRRLPVHMLF